MLNEEIKEKKKVSIAQTLDLLEQRKKTGALTYEQQTSYNYCINFSALPNDKTSELFEKLVAMDLSEDIAINIVDIFPVDKSTLEIILLKQTVKPEDVLKIIDQYRDISVAYREELMAKKTKEKEMEKQKQEKQEKEKQEKEEKDKEKQEKQEKDKKEEEDKKQDIKVVATEKTEKIGKISKTKTVKAVKKKVKQVKQDKNKPKTAKPKKAKK